MKKYSVEFIKTCMALFVLIPLVIGVLVFSKFLLQLLIVIVGLGMIVEWYNMTKTSNLYLSLGLVIIPAPIASALLITMLDANYQYSIFTAALIIVAMDSAAMFGGQKFKGPKLAQKISPNKTWSGLITGIIACVISVRLAEFLPGYDFIYRGFELSIFAAVIGLLAQISDLFISCFKRCFNLKESGHIIPGHGGLLDRFDSWILTSPLILYILL
jgi:phosphatidate cytidylyltransferase